MTTHYTVKVANGTSFEPQVWGNKGDMVLVHKGPILPCGPGELVMLHKVHANGSRPMIFEPKSGCFVCVHCGVKSNLSDSLFQLILAMLTVKKYGLIYEQNNPIKVEIAHLVESFPSNPESGWYAVKCVEIEVK